MNKGLQDASSVEQTTALPTMDLSAKTGGPGLLKLFIIVVE